MREWQLGREIFLKFCLALTEEVNNPVPSSDSLTRRNADIRDSMRVSETAVLCEFWRGILREFTNDSCACSFAVLALDCLAAYSRWIDVNLVVEGETLKLIYYLLQSPQCSVQEASAACLSEIVLKGMPANDKISLGNYMNLGSVFGAVRDRGQVDGFFGMTCRILSNLGCSLLQQVSISSNSNDSATDNATAVHDQVVRYLTSDLLPHLIGFMRLLVRVPRRARSEGNWEESLAALLPFIGGFFEVARGMRDEMQAEQVEFISQFLPLCLDLAEVSDDRVVLGEEEAYEESEVFDQLRGSLLQAFESVLWLQGHGTIAHLNAMRSGSEPLSLGRCELLCRLVLRLPEGMRGSPIFSISVNGNCKATPVAELCTWVIEEIPKRHVRLLAVVGRVLVRYSSTSLFDQFPHLIEVSLNLLMNLGEGCEWCEGGEWCELLLRFVKNLKGKVGNYALGLLGVLQGPMNRRGSALGKSTSKSSTSVCLYEIAGLAVGSLDSSGGGVEMEPILGALLQESMTLSMRHVEMTDEASNAVDCLAAFAKGFASDSSVTVVAPVRSSVTSVRSWFSEYTSNSLKGQCSCSAKYLNALMGLAQRMIPLLQGESVDLVREVAACVIGPHVVPDESVSASELMSQCLSLLSAACFKLRDRFANRSHLGLLWGPLLVRLHGLLHDPIQGTDDLVHYMSLSRSTLSFLQALSCSPCAMECTLQSQSAGASIEALLVRMTEQSVSAAPADCIGLLRSLCGLLVRLQGSLSADFLVCKMVPLLLHQSLPRVCSGLDPSSRKSVHSLPAAFVSLVQDLLGLLRALHQNGRGCDSWASWNGQDLLTGDLKETRNALIEGFVLPQAARV